MNKMIKEDQIIGYIEKGIVIDHIPFGEVWRIAEILGVTKEKKARVSLGDGYESKKLGKKGVIKIQDSDITNYQINLIALIAKDASISIIKDGKVFKKIQSRIPECLKGVIMCPNIACISNDSHEKVISLINFKGDRGFICHYCSREFMEDEIKFF